MDKIYSILRSKRTGSRSIETVVESGLSWDIANIRRERLTELEIAAQPTKTSWTRDIFIIKLEGAAPRTRHPRNIHR
jgi:hypothetical protein